MSIQTQELPARHGLKSKLAALTLAAALLGSLGVAEQVNAAPAAATFNDDACIVHLGWNFEVGRRVNIIYAGKRAYQTWYLYGTGSNGKGCVAKAVWTLYSIKFW